ncbi:hypothetical protein [Mucilaginibacter sp. 44-25]|uniref:hypothetical protein n=1 Tax=Mucilaginibacter sp. 44-25 TaxID=1895794 RepID=UPI0025EFA546|nr:hypothetical protein [Mucilaginibacter sp. 44-25]
MPITPMYSGGNMNALIEIIVQLWVPGNADQQERSMKVGKTLSKVEIVNKCCRLTTGAR